MAKQPDDVLWLEEIEEELISLARIATQRWQKIAVLMLDVEEQSLWQGAAPSYTAWVQARAQKADVHESTLWRALQAGKFYLGVREQQAADAPEHATQLPELGKLESTASPESFELIEKISRAVAPATTLDLVEKTLAGETTRQDLRQTWQDYRPAVRGTAHGRGRAMPRAEPPKVLAADILQALRSDRGRFVDSRERRHRFALYTDIIVHRTNERFACRLDAVCAEMHTEEQIRPMLHGIEIKVEEEALHGELKLESLADYVDTLWLAVPSACSRAAQRVAPPWVGVLAYVPLDERRQPLRPLRVVRRARRSGRRIGGGSWGLSC